VRVKENQEEENLCVKEEKRVEKQENIGVKNLGNKNKNILIIYK